MKSVPTLLRGLAVACAMVIGHAGWAQPCTADAMNTPPIQCPGTTFPLTGSASGGQAPYTYQWSPATGLSNPNAQNPVLTVPASSTVYTLTITDSNGCTDTDNVTVVPLPGANASLSSANAQFTVFNGVPTFYRCGGQANALFIFDFNGAATANANHTINWGDGSANYTATGTTWPTQNHSYGQGIYTLTYTLTQSNGCNNTQTYSIFLGTNPAVGIGNPGNTAVCGPNQLVFPITGTGSNPAGTIYTVTFNDGSAPVSFTHPAPASVTHLFTLSSCGTTSSNGITNFPNSFSATIEAENPCGLSSGSVVPIYVSTPPITDFTISPNDTACVNTTVTFSNTSQSGAEAPACSGTSPALWSISPAAGWTVNSGTLGNSNGFIGANFDPGSWSPGSASLGVQFNTPGSYTVKLLGGNLCGGDSLQRSICVEAPPTAAFTLAPNPICQGQQVNTDNTSTAPNSCSIRYQWLVNQTASYCASGNTVNFVGGTSATSFEPVIQFASAGTYNVVLQAINSCPVVQATQPVTVVGPPQVSMFPVGPICQGQSIFPVASFQQCGGVLGTPQWTATGAAPATSTGTNPGGFAYATAGNYTVQVSVTNQCGNAQTSQPLVVNPTPPTANATATSINLCAGQAIQLQATAIANATYSWTGPNGFTSTQQNPSLPNATVAMSGTYTVTASLGIVCGGPPSSVTITVNPAPILSITPNSPSLCAGASVTLTANGGSGYTWTANGNPAGAGNSITVSPGTTTTYTVNGAGLGCSGTASTTVTVTPPPVVSAGTDQIYCNQPIPQQLNGTPVGGTWSGSPNVTAGGIYTPPLATGIYILTYTYTDANNCTGTDQAQITVNTVTNPASTGPNVTVCAGTPTLNLFAMPAGGTWSGAGVTPGGLFNPTTPGVYPFTYTVGTGTCQTSDPLTVTVVANPAAQTPPDQSVCVNTPSMQLNGLPAGGVWSGPVVTSTGAFDPVLAGPGVFNLVYTYTNANGCFDTDPMVLTVNALPVVSAGNDQTFCDQPIPQQLTGSPVGGTWSGPNVSAAGLFTASGTGVFTLTYTYTDANSCVNTDQEADITVVPVTNPANAGPDVAACVGSAAVQLNGAPVGGTWSGTGVTVTGLFTPSTVGAYLLTYSVGTATCVTQDQLTATVNALPVVDAGASQVSCIDGGVFNLLGTPPGGSWTGTAITAAGAFDPAVAGVGSYVQTYTYTDANSCTSTDNTTTVVNGLPVVSAGNDQLYCDQPIPQQLTGAPLGGSWTGTNVNSAGLFTPNGVGVFVVNYTYTDANFCSGTDQATITVIPVVNPANAGADIAVCINSAAFQLNGLPAGGTWSGSALVTAGGLFTPSMAGVYVLTYSEGSGTCVTQDQVTVTVNALPIVDAGLSPRACLDAGTQTVSGTPAGGTWSGTGITDPALGTFDPAVSGVGPFALTYTYTDANGCINSDGTTYTVDPLPIAGFSNAPIACENVAFPFTDGSSGASFWTWDFGDNTGNALTANPQHTYADSGTYVVTQVVTTTFGCDDTTSTNLIVWEQPVVVFSAAPVDGCGPLNVAFTNTSTGTGTTYDWDFGNGLSSALQNPNPVTFVASAFADTVYTVTLTGTNLCGAVQDTEPITVYPTPTALFGPDLNTGCSPWTPTFSNVTIGQASSFFWDFGDGTTLATMDSLVQHTFTTGSTNTTYTVTLIATNNCGADTATYDIVVQPNTVTAFFNTDTLQGCAPVTVNFTQYSIGATNWGWDFGDGNVSTVQSPTHTYPNAGTYTVQLFADNGCSYDTTTQVITVFPSPAVAFTWAPDSVCAGDLFQFTNLTPNTANIVWDFDDGTTSLLSDPDHTYAATGTYSVTATVTSSINGCVAALTQDVTVKTTPIAAFAPSPNSGCAPLAVQFQNTSVAGDFYTWTFGDNNTSGVPAPAHTYAAAGTYVVQLVAQSLSGCSDTAYAQVVVFPVPVAAFTFAPDSGCVSPSTVQFTNQSQGAISFTWTFGNGQGSALNDPVTAYGAPGTYPVQLIAENAFGCRDTTVRNFTVYPTPEALFTVEPSPGCDTYPVTFLNTSVNASAQWWSLGDGTFSTDPQPAYIYPGVGLYDVTLVVSGAGGCLDTLTVIDAVLIQPTPLAAFTYDGATSVPNALQFTNTSEGAVSYWWNFGDGDESNVTSPLHLFPADGGEVDICLIATNQLGCPDTTCIELLIPSNPAIYTPNAFTPDSDGLNDDFRPVLDGFSDWRYQLLIFDRWGEVVWETRSRTTAWDGSMNGKPCKTDVYVWKVILDRYGDEREVVGHVTLVRGDY